jgi:hypothetical protein
MSFEDEYMDVLQNIEWAIINVYHRHPELMDANVEQALNALVVEYQAEQRDRTATPTSLADLPQEVYDSVRPMCEWRMGRAALFHEEGQQAAPDLTPITLEEMVACLKRVRKSVRMWTKERGRQGYLLVVDRYVK